VDRISHWRTRLYDQPVEREVVWWSTADFSSQDLGQVGSPLVDRLAGPAIDEVKADIRESRSSRGRDRFRNVVDFMQPAKHTQPAPVKRLCTDAEATHA
jgi:hypothetical protein